MAINSKTRVNINDINTEFTEIVINSILKDAYDINNVPKDGTYFCIEPERLGDITKLPLANSGTPNTIVNGMSLYDNLVALTTVLTRVGTFSYLRRYKVNSSYQAKFRLSGKALFTSDYTKKLASVPTDSIEPGKVISSNSINQLFTDLLTAWKNTEKHNNTITISLCHSNCHSNCHSDCHTDSNCYK